MPFRALGAFGRNRAPASGGLGGLRLNALSGIGGFRTHINPVGDAMDERVLMPFRALGAFGRPDLAARFLFDDLCPHPLTRYFTQLQSFMSSLLFPKSGSHHYPSRHAANTPLFLPFSQGHARGGVRKALTWTSGLRWKGTLQRPFVERLERPSNQRARSRTAGHTLSE